MSRPGISKRILMLLENESFPDDVRVFLEAESLVNVGYDVMVICPTGQSRKWTEEVGSVRVYRYPKPRELGGTLGYVWEYGFSITALFLWSVFVFLRRGFDVVHVHTPPDMTAMIAVFYQLAGKRFVFDHHDLSPELYLARRGDAKPDVVYRLLLFFERFACRHADRLIATNASQKSVQIERCGADPDYCYVVRNGPNELFLKETEPRPELNKQGRLVLGYVGIIGVQDGVDNMIRMIDRLRTVHHREDFFAVIVGDGPAAAELRNLVDEFSVADLVCITGMVPFSSIPAYIASFDICFTPDPINSYNDSCTTIKTMEYMALRKPVVCFRTRENQLTAGDAALYADNNDVAAFARATVRLMDDPVLRQTLGKIGRERIERSLTWNHQAMQLVALYDDLFGLPAREATRVVKRDPVFASSPSSTRSSENLTRRKCP